MAKEAYYFSHDSNARHDPKITVMRSVYGSEGYGWYWILIEMMRESEGYKLDLKSKYVWNAYALQMQCDSNRAELFVNDCINEFDLFCTDNISFWSPSLHRRMSKREEVTEAKRKAAKARWDKEKKEVDAQEEGDKNEQINADGMHMHSTSNANGMQLKERKVNKSKVNKIKDIKDIKDSGQAEASPSTPKRFIPPTLEEVKAYCEERQNGIDADKWIDFYTSNGWMVGRNKMKDWKATVRYWERNTISNYQKQNTAKPSKPYIPTVSKNDAPASTMTEEEKQALLQKYAEAKKKKAEAELAVTKLDDSDWR